MAKSNGGTRAGANGIASAPALSGPALWAARREEAPGEISKALADAGYNATVRKDGSVSVSSYFYDKDKPVEAEASIALYNAEDKTYLVFGTKKKILDRFQVNDNGGRGRIAIGTKEYARRKKMNNMVDSLPEAVALVDKFLKKF